MDWVKQLNIAIRYIEDHLTGTIEYDELAKMLCCSTYQFQRMFAFMNNVRFLYKGIIINHNKKPSQPTLKRRFFQEKGGVFFMARFGKGVVLTLY